MFRYDSQLLNWDASFPSVIIALRSCFRVKGAGFDELMCAKSALCFHSLFLLSSGFLNIF